MEPNELSEKYVLKAYADIKRRAEEDEAKSGDNWPSSSAVSARKFPFVLAQLRSIRSNSLILDIEQNCAFVLADANHSPFRKGIFDVILLVSVLHHIPCEEMRLKCLRNCLWLASPRNGRIVTAVWAKEQKAAKFPSNDVLVPYNLEDAHKLGHTVEIPFNRDTTREQRIMMNAVPIRVKVPLNVRCPNYLPKSVRQRVLEVVSRAGWLYPMISVAFYEQQLQFMANFIIDRLAELRRIRADFSLKNGPARANPHLSIGQFALKVSASAFDDAFVRLRTIYRDVLKYRYYHLFVADELDDLMLKIWTIDRNLADFQPIICEYEMGNWCAVIGKIGDIKETGRGEG
ncbi:hypothetical protein niasHT_010337 [Heterodera trifolii]|uniref:Methyltransferase type 11 domain-containing protein n=1 Tax=Heterodera trifolii TaxID=157864 RepID=A0ABD2M6N1_9BILA